MTIVTTTHWSHIVLGKIPRLTDFGQEIMDLEEELGLNNKHPILKKNSTLAI